ncbi:MAG: hypothetical protein ACPLWB_00290 [Caldisericia bacterium]
MEEIIFLIEGSEEGGYTLKALGESISTEKDTVEEVKKNIIDGEKVSLQ